MATYEDDGYVHPDGHELVRWLMDSKGRDSYRHFDVRTGKRKTMTLYNIHELGERYVRLLVLGGHIIGLRKLHRNWWKYGRVKVTLTGKDGREARSLFDVKDGA